MFAEIKLFAGNFAPVDWEFCQGQVLRISDYEALFTLVGTQFGGDGITSFNLPKLTPLIPTGAGQTPVNYIICVNGVYPPRPPEPASDVLATRRPAASAVNGYPTGVS